MKKREPSFPEVLNRRNFVSSGVAGLGGTLLAVSSAPGFQAEAGSPFELGDPPENLPVAPPLATVRIGFVGVGGMGTVHVRNLARIPGARIQAICDIREEHAARSRQIVLEAGQPEPRLYTRSETDFVRLCQEEDLDLVYNATPWRWHVPIALTAMANGKHAASEVPFATTLEDCWALVESAEKHQKHCVMMENCNYSRMEMMMFLMARQGLFGEILHGECGYLHDLREIKFADAGEGLWRREHSKNRNGNLYPTHGLGPIANCMDINRGDRFQYLVSMSSPSRGLQNWARDHYPLEHPKRRETYALGDVNTSLIRTERGKTIFLSHDTNLPRPYSRINMLQGTRGLFQGYPDRLYLEGRSEPHQWDPAESYLPEYEHPLWRKLGGEEEGTAHGSMDYLEDYRLIKCLREGLPTDMNVYDAAALSAICELSEISVAGGSQPVEFPDFTRGRWQTWPQLGIVEA